MFAARLMASFKRDRKVRTRRVDVITEQVKKVLQTADQKLILMVRS